MFRATNTPYIIVTDLILLLAGPEVRIYDGHETGGATSQSTRIAQPVGRSARGSGTQQQQRLRQQQQRRVQQRQRDDKGEAWHLVTAALHQRTTFLRAEESQSVLV